MLVWSILTVSVLIVIAVVVFLDRE